MISRVLLADDEPDLFSSLGRILKMRGLTVDLAGSGEEAVEMACESVHDAIFMDMRMPGMGGLEACHRLKVFQKGALIIMMTGFLEMENEAKVEGIEVITKPVDPARLCEFVSN